MFSFFTWYVLNYDGISIHDKNRCLKNKTSIYPKLGNRQQFVNL